jgi:serralysin
MATIRLNVGMNLNDLDAGNWLYLQPYVATSSVFSGRYSFDKSASATFTGHGFTYAPDGTPLGGTVTGYVESYRGAVSASLTDISVPVSAAMAAATSGSHFFFSYLMAGSDVIYGSAFKDYLYGHAGDDRIYAGNGDDWVDGGTGHDYIAGEGGFDMIFGDDGDDIIIGGVGPDWLYGDGGLDTSVYAGKRGTYMISDGVLSSSGERRTVTGGGEDDVISSFERLSFSDGTLAFDTSGNAGQSYRLYQAAFDRVPDAQGLTYWVRSLDKGTIDLKQAADAFIGSSEFAARYGAAPSIETFVIGLYNNVLDRAPDAAGLAHWGGVLERGAATRAEVLIGFSESNENQANVAGAISKGIFLEYSLI